MGFTTYPSSNDITVSNDMKTPRKYWKDRLEMARNHAFAILVDRGKFVETAIEDRIPTLTMIAHLGITFVGGKTIEEAKHADGAIVYWHETDAMRWQPATDKVSDKQQSARDKRLLETAIEETMKNRRQQYYTKMR